LNAQHTNQKEIVGLQNTNQRSLQADNQKFLKNQQDDTQTHQTGLATLQHKQAVDLADSQQVYALERIYETAAASKPEAAKMYDYMIESGVATDVKEAMQVVQSMKSDPQKTILELVGKAKAAQIEAMIRPGDPRYMSDEDIIKLYTDLLVKIPEMVKAGDKQPPPAISQPGLGDTAAPPAPATGKGNRPPLSSLL
jgi:hypothetical protein